MTWDEINDWWDGFYSEVIGGKRVVRGATWSGGHLRIWDRDTVSVVLTDPYLVGSTDDARAASFVKKVFDPEFQEIHAELGFDRFRRIVLGEDKLVDGDWFRLDE